MAKNIIINIIKTDGSIVPVQSRHTATDVISAKQTWVLNADDKIDIVVESTCPQSYDIGDRITLFGRDYKLNQLPEIEKSGAHKFRYTLVFEGIQYDLLRAMYDVNINTTNNELQDIQGDTLTGDLHRFMTVLIANANRIFPGKWVLGECPETVSDKTLTFGESDNCLLVLQNLCSKNNFNCEYEILSNDGIYTINLKSAVGQILPYTFKFGRGNGLYKLTRKNVSTSNIVTRLKAYGSTENITSKYRADRLCLPDKSKAQSYIEKEVVVQKYGIFEGRKNFDEIKPTYTGTVESVFADDMFSFIDANFPFDINELEADGETTKYLINGVSPKIHFNTGNLASYEFELKSYDHATHKFTLKQFEDSNGYLFPSETSLAFQFSVGNTYKIINIAYSKEIEEEAEALLATKSNEYYDQNCQPKVQYALDVTKAWLEQLISTNENDIVNAFSPGDYLHIIDEEIGVDKSVRIKSFVRDVFDPYEYQMTISDLPVTITNINRVLSELIEIDKIIRINDLDNPARARANWRTSREVLDMVFDPEGDYYTDKIKPNSIDTLMLSVGAKSMQFSLTNTVFEPNYGGNVNLVKWQGGILTHYAINPDMALVWNLANGEITLGSDDAYYIYAKCSRADSSGLIVITQDQITVESDANYYHFLIGVLNSADANLGARSIYLMYGFTTINGRFIKTGRIMPSGGGTSYFDLDTGEVFVGDEDAFMHWKDKQLRIQGVINVSPSGDEFPNICWRGEYDPTKEYFYADGVTYQGQAYVYIYGTSSKGNTPSKDSIYWMVYVAKGDNGYITFKSTAFKRTNGDPGTPSGGTFDVPIPDGWSDGIPDGEEMVWATTRIFSTDPTVQEDWTAPKQMTDTADFDVEFSSVEDPAPPIGHPNTNTQWSNHSDSTTIWMATSRCKNGVWENWQISKIKGENGIDGANGMDGVPGEPGKDGITYYTWIRYADDEYGNGISNDPTGKSFIGFAYNKLSPQESSNKEDYIWSNIKGTDGVPGAPGADGTTYYTWIAYSDYADGTDLYQIPNENTKYIGIAVNKLTPIESSNKEDYTWSRFRGADGDNGSVGISPIWCRWQPNQKYYNGDLTSSNPDRIKHYVNTVLDGKVQAFECITSHTSGSSFNLSYWNPISYMPTIATEVMLATYAAIENAYIKELKTRESASQQIHIHDNIISVNNENGESRLVIHGGAMKDSGSASSVNVTSSEYSETINRSAGKEQTDSQSYTLATFYVSNAANQVSIPKIDLDVIISSVGNGTMTLYGSILLDGSVIASTSVSAQDGQDHASNSISLAAHTRTLSPGSHTLEVIYNWECYFDAGTSNSFMVDGSTTSGTIVVNYISQYTEIANNGFKTQWGTNKYFLVQLVNNVLTMMMQNSNGVLKIASDGVRISHSGAVNPTDFAVSASEIKKIEVVSNYPSSPDANTLYLKRT